jgi:hypothetical protein
MMDSKSVWNMYSVLFQNKFEKWCISLAFIIRMYYDARFSECQILLSPICLCTDEGLNTWLVIQFLVYIDISGDMFFKYQ